MARLRYDPGDGLYHCPWGCFTRDPSPCGHPDSLPEGFGVSKRAIMHKRHRADPLDALADRLYDVLRRHGIDA